MRNLRQMLCILALLLSAVGAKARYITSGDISIFNHILDGGYIEVRFVHYDDDDIFHSGLYNKNGSQSFIQINGTKVVEFYSLSSAYTYQNKGGSYWCRYKDLGSSATECIEYRDNDGSFKDLPTNEWLEAKINKWTGQSWQCHSVLRINLSDEELAKGSVNVGVTLYNETDSYHQSTETKSADYTFTPTSRFGARITFTDKLTEEGYVEVKFPHYYDREPYEGLYRAFPIPSKVQLNGKNVFYCYSLREGNGRQGEHDWYWCDYYGKVDKSSSAVRVEYKDADGEYKSMNDSVRYVGSIPKETPHLAFTTIRIYPTGDELDKGEIKVDVKLRVVKIKVGDYWVEKSAAFTFTPPASKLTADINISKDKPGCMIFSFKSIADAEKYTIVNPDGGQDVELTATKAGEVITGDIKIKNYARKLEIKNPYQFTKYQTCTVTSRTLIPAYCFPAELKAERTGNSNVKLSWDVKWISNNEVSDQKRIEGGNWILQRSLNAKFDDAVTLTTLSSEEKLDQTVSFTFTDEMEDIDYDLEAIYYRLRKDNNEWEWKDGGIVTAMLRYPNNVEIVTFPGKLNAICRTTNGSLEGDDALKIYTFEGIYGDHFYGTTVEGNYIEAGKPYVYETTEKALYFVSDKENFANETDGKWFAYNGLHGVLADNCDKGENFRTVSGSDYLVFTKDGTQKPAEGGTRVELGCCYLVFSEAEMPDLTAMPANARRIARRDGDTTNLTPALSINGEGDDRMFNVFGQPVDENYKGIVIRNGKKIIRK